MGLRAGHRGTSGVTPLEGYHSPPPFCISNRNFTIYGNSTVMICQGLPCIIRNFGELHHS